MQVFNQNDEENKTNNTNENKKVKTSSLFPENQIHSSTSLKLKLFFFLFGFIGLQVIATIVSVFFMRSKMDSDSVSFWINFLSYTICIATVIAVIFSLKSKPWKILLSELKSWKVYAFGAGVVIIMYLINIIFSLMYKSIPNYNENMNQSAINQMITKNPLFSTLSFFEIVLFAPVIEELTYRFGLGGLIVGKKKRYVVAILVSSLIFGLIHFNGLTIQMTKLEAEIFHKAGESGNSSLIQLAESLNFTGFANGITETSYNSFIDHLNILMRNEWLNLPIYIISGACLGSAYFFSGKLSSSIFGHALNNLLSYVFMFVPSGAMILFSF